MTGLRPEASQASGETDPRSTVDSSPTAAPSSLHTLSRPRRLCERITHAQARAGEGLELRGDTVKISGQTVFGSDRGIGEAVLPYEIHSLVESRTDWGRC